MAKRIPLVVPYYKDLVRNLQSTPKAAIASNYKLSFSNANHAHLHAQGANPLAKEGAEEVMESVEEARMEIVDTAWDATKKTSQLITETTTAEADTNVVDTSEYRSAEDLNGQLGDGCDKIEL